MRTRLLGCLLVVFPVAARAAITVTIGTPATGDAVGDTVSISAGISSTYQITSVQAQIGAVSGPMTAAASSTGTLDISSVATGSVMLTVTATDTFGGTGSSSITFKHDRAPTLTVAEPLNGTVARPSLHINATCADPDFYGCATIEARLGSTSGTLIASTNATTLIKRCP